MPSALRRSSAAMGGAFKKRLWGKNATDRQLKANGKEMSGALGFAIFVQILLFVHKYVGKLSIGGQQT